MFVIVRSYTDAGLEDELARHAQQEVIPMLMEQPGFRAFFAFETKDGRFISISDFNDREAGLAANERILAWVKENLSELVPNPPEIAFGEALFPQFAPERSNRGIPYHIDMVTFEGVTQAPESIMPRASRHLFPVITRQSGFAGMYNFRSEADPGRWVSIHVFDTQQASDAASETAQALVNEKLADIFPLPPKRVGGTALIAVTA